MQVDGHARGELQQVGAGVALGIALAIASARLLQTMLWGVSSSDPLTILAVTFCLLAVALVAILIPALRVTRLDPLRAMRES